MSGNIFYAGCSFTANSGFDEARRPECHWPWLLAQRLGLDQTNLAVGGCSNEEIFYRCIEHLTTHRPKLAVVMWSSLSRKWVYPSRDNVDDYTIMNLGHVSGLSTQGLNKDLGPVREYAKLHYAYFDNHYVEIKRWLLQILALEHLTKSLGINAVFIKGFENFLSDFMAIARDPIQGGFSNIRQEIKSMLDFDHRPDDYIWQKIAVIQDLVSKIDRDRWIEFDDYSFRGNQVDLADDRVHPGIQTNQQLVDKIMLHIEKRGIKF